MTAQQLRNSILQQAIQGRLVPQDPNDEPASVLLERIRKEKEQLVKEGKLKKKDLATTPIADDEKPFDIPKGWEWVNIDQIATVKGGKRLPVGEKFSDIPTPYIYIRVTEMKNNTLQDNDLRYISAELHELLKNYTIHSTDLYLTIAGTIGAVGDVPEKFDGMNLTENALKLTNLQVDKKFLIYCLSSDFVQSQFKDKTNKVGQPKLAMERVKSTVFPLPPLAEQRRIVAKIEELMPLVEKYGKAQTELDTLNQDLPRRLRQSVLQQAIQGKLVEQDPNDEPASGILEKIKLEKESLLSQKILKKIELEDYTLSVDEVSIPIPDGWSFVKLREICTLIDGEKRTEKHICMDAKYLRGKSSGEYLTQGKFVTKGSNIILVDGENSGEVFVTPIDGYMGSTFKQLWISQEMYTPYVMYVLRSFKETLRKDKRGAAIPHLNKDLFFNFEVGIPPLAEQRRIVAKIEELFAEIDKLK